MNYAIQFLWENNPNLSFVCLIAAELHLASYESEGPENNMEKDSRRSLRWVSKHTCTHHPLHIIHHLR